MRERRDQIAVARALGQAGFDADSMTALLAEDVGRWQLRRADMNSMGRAIGLLAGPCGTCPGTGWPTAGRHSSETPGHSGPPGRIGHR